MASPGSSTTSQKYQTSTSPQQQISSRNRSTNASTHPARPKYTYVLPIDILHVRQCLEINPTRLALIPVPDSDTPSNLTPSLTQPHSPPLTPPCSCPEDIVHDLQPLHQTDDPEQKKQLFLYVADPEIGFNALCRPHLRTFASLTTGLYNNVSNTLLIHRLTEIRRSPSLDLARQINPDWFQKSVRTESEADYLVVYRYPSLQTPPFQFNPQQIFNRFAGPDAWATWHTDGTIILPDIFQYLNHPDIIAAIDTEFAMYLHHFRPVPGRPQMGFLRNMFYSLIQQLLRQDPVWYALMAAARPNHSWRLISYPYTAKCALEGDRTAFLHLDLNIREYISSGRGANTLSISISLDTEDDQGCTLVVPGFHNHIREWHQRRIARGEDSAGTTTNCNAQYHPQDRAEPLYDCHRADMHRLLFETAARMGATLHLGSRVEKYAEDDDGAEVTVNGKSWRGDVVISADGVKSRVRIPVIGYEEKTLASGYALYRAFFDANIIKNDPLTSHLVLDDDDARTGWIGPDVHAIVSTIKRGKEFNWVLTHRDESGIDESWVFPGKTEEALKCIEGWDPLIRTCGGIDSQGKLTGLETHVSRTSSFCNTHLQDRY
jgi:hypothetical protein